MHRTPRVRDKIFAWLAKRRVPGHYRVMKLLWGRSRPLLLVRTNEGLSLRLDPASYIDSHIIRSGYYEQEVLEAVLSGAVENSVIWDIGANIGLHSLTLKRMRPACIVCAFEPAPVVLKRLRAHVEKNGLDVIVYPVGLSDQSGSLLLSEGEPGNHGLSSFKPWSGVKYDREVECDVRRADDLIASGRAPQPDVIKIDVEGAEFEVLSGFGALLGAVRTVVFEAPASCLVDCNSSPLIELLTSFGFAITKLHASNPDSSNFVATRR